MLLLTNTPERVKMSQADRKIFSQIFFPFCDKQAPPGVFLVKAFQRKSVRDDMTQTEFIPLAKRYKDTVYRIALNYYGSPYDADDTVQDVLLKLFQRGESFENEEHARYWIIRVTINQCKNGLRWAKLRRHESLENVKASVQFQQPEHSEVYSQVMALPERYRTVLYLFYYEELSVNKIAQLLGVKPSVVTTRLSRARQKLKTKLTEVWQDEE